MTGGVLGDDRAVGVGLEAVGDDQRDLEGGLLGRLVEAGEGPPRVGGLHLGGGDGAGDAVGVDEGRSVEPDELVVEDPGEHHRDRGGAHREVDARGEGRTLGLGIEGHAALVAVSCDGDRSGRDLEVDGVEDDRRHRRGDLDIDLHLAGEDRLVEVGGEHQAVVPREDVVAESIGVEGVGHVPRLPGRPHSLRR